MSRTGRRAFRSSILRTQPRRKSSARTRHPRWPATWPSADRWCLWRSGLERFRCCSAAETRITRAAGTLLHREAHAEFPMRPLLNLRDGRAHVGLDLDRGQRPVVNANLVNETAEVFTPDGVTADSQRTVTDRRGACDRSGPSLSAVHKEAKRSSVVGDGQMRPGVQRYGGRPCDAAIATDIDEAHRARGIVG